MDGELKIPNHVGIIMDGNGRWATSRGLKRTAGHKAGSENLKKLCIHIADKGVKYLSVYAFSTENFKRERSEVDFLMNLFFTVFNREFDFIMEKKIKVVFSGRREPLPNKVLKMIDEITEKTKNNTGPIFNICVNYGGRPEIIDTTQKLCEKVVSGEIRIDDIDENLFSQNLYNDLPAVDLMIRTSGEVRLSNFLLWQNAYAEFYFPEVEFPDFNEKEFDKAIDEFNRRNRRFGGQ